MDINDADGNSFLGSTSNAPGAADNIFVIKASDIDAWPALAPTPTTLEEEVELVGDFTLATGKTWGELYGSSDTTNVKFTQSTGRDSNSWLAESIGFTPGMTSAALGFAKKLAEARKVIVLVKDNECDAGTDRYWVVGTKCKPAKIEEQVIDAGLGDDDSGTKGNAWKMSARQPNLLVYTGAVVTV